MPLRNRLARQSATKFKMITPVPLEMHEVDFSIRVYINTQVSKKEKRKIIYYHWARQLDPAASV
jgi:hypothetical protein